MGKATKKKPAGQQTAPAQAHAAAEQQGTQPKKKAGAWILHPRTKGSLALHIVLDLLIPYAYLMLCGLIFDRWLRLYNMTTFVFFSYAALQLAGIVFAILCAVNYGKRRKKKK